jgi:hypothetical protein
MILFELPFYIVPESLFVKIYFVVKGSIDILKDSVAPFCNHFLILADINKKIIEKGKQNDQHRK